MDSRRGFLGAASGALAAAALASRANAAEPVATGNLAAGGNPAATVVSGSAATDGTVPFYGAHQAGIDTLQQTQTVFASFDLRTEKAADIERLLVAWTDAAARLMAGETVAPLGSDAGTPPLDSGEVLGLPSRRLTLTFGFAPTMFEQAGKDRFGLRSRKPAALVALPRFNGDQLVEAQSGGDLCIQACADDSQVAFHAIRQLARIAVAGDAAAGDASAGYGRRGAAAPATGPATLRWMQAGFVPDSPVAESPRNLLGFHDGTDNPGAPGIAERANGKAVGNGTPAESVWVGNEGPAWMRGGTYLVVRKVRLFLEHWDRSNLAFQQQVIGRHKASGAPLSGGTIAAPLDLDALDKDGNPLIPENAHVRVASASATHGARISRRSYSYNNGLSMVAERWPPWRQGLEYDAGLLFVAHQRDPRTGFIPMFERMSKFDLLNQYATHVASAIFAVPSGARRGVPIGHELFA